MSVRSLSITVAAVGVVGAVSGLASVRAASAVVSGWWTSAPVAVAPDVTDNQLLVQGGQDPAKPVAYAGISFALAQDEEPQKLVLSVAANSATTPGAKLALCRLGAPASPAKGDSASGGPPFDCAAKVQAGPSSNGSTYEFAVGTLARQGTLDVAVLPTQPTDRVVLSKPALDALHSESGSSASSPTDVSDTGAVSGTGGSDVGGAAADVGSTTATADLGVTGGPTESATSPATVPAATAATGRAGTDAGNPNVRLSTPAVSQRTGGTSRSLAPFAFGGMVVAALALWALAGQRSPEAAVEPGDTSDTGEFG